MKSSNEAFLDYFNDIESFFNKEYKPNRGKSYYSFYELVENASRYDSFVKRKRNDFQILGDLRNFLSHGNQSDLVLVNEESLNLIKAIHEQLLKPKTAFDIRSGDVKFFKETTPLSAVLETIRNTDLTQFPIKDGKGKVRGLLTENGITHWLSQHAHEATVSIDGTLARDILVLDENKNNFAFIKKDATIYEAEAQFDNQKIDALLVTHSGKNTENLLGIITRFDLVEV
nr:CBS domain-containing protein [uncultured Trichococcus sp.]